jgi:hypothetical protein
LSQFYGIDDNINTLWIASAASLLWNILSLISSTHARQHTKKGAANGDTNMDGRYYRPAFAEIAECWRVCDNFQKFGSCKHKWIDFSAGFTYKLNKVQQGGGGGSQFEGPPNSEKKNHSHNILSINREDIKRSMEKRHRGSFAPCSAAVRVLQAAHLWNALHCYLNIYIGPHGLGPREVLISPLLDGGNIYVRAF